MKLSFRAFGWTVATALLIVTLIGAYLSSYVGSYVDLLLMLVFVGWTFLQGGWRSETAGHLALVAFVVLAVVFVVTNPAGRTDFLYIANFLGFLLLGPLAVGFSLLARPGNALIVARLALLGTLAAAGLALLQVYVQHLPYAMGLGGSNRINSAGVAILLGFLAMMGYFAEKLPHRLIYLSGPLLALVVLFLSGSRGPLLVVLVLSSVLLVAVVRRRWLAIALGLVVVGLMVGALLLFPSSFGRIGRLPSIVLETLSGAHLKDNSAAIRLNLYKASWKAFLDSPIVGHGWGEKAAAAYRYLEPGPFRGQRNTWHLHSDIADFAVAGGVVGLLAYFSVVLAPLLGALRSRRDGQFAARLYGGATLTVGFLAYGSFNFAFGFEYLTIFFVAAAAIVVGFCKDQPLLGRHSSDGSILPS